MNVYDMTVKTRKGERAKSHPDAVRVHLNTEQAADLVVRLTEELAKGSAEITVSHFGELLQPN